jgi:hypothetical protein
VRTWREMLSEKVHADKPASLKVAMLTSGMGWATHSMTP